MKWLRSVGLGEISPLGILAVGALIGLAGMPAVKKGASAITVSTIGAVLSAADYLKNAGCNITNEWHNMFEDARKQREDNFALRQHLHEAGVGLTGAGMAVAEKARVKFQDYKDNIENKLANIKDNIQEKTNDLSDDSDTLQNQYQQDNSDFNNNNI